MELYGDELKELPVPKLDSHQLGTAIQWLEDHANYKLTVDEFTNQYVPLALSERDKAVVEGQEAENYASMLVAADFPRPSIRPWPTCSRGRQ